MKRLVPLLLVLAACSGGSSEQAAPRRPADLACTSVLLPSADLSAKMPEGLPPIDGQTLILPSVQGKTHIVFAHLPTADFVKVRDDYVEQLRAAGWTIDGTDQESVEAEAQFSKTPPLIAGSVRVAPLCKGHVSVRFRLSL